jgi:hypothetical protein
MNAADLLALTNEGKNQMAYEVRHTNSAGAAESQTVSERDVLALISKIERLGGADITVSSANGDRWTAEEADVYLGANRSS